MSFEPKIKLPIKINPGTCDWEDADNKELYWDYVSDELQRAYQEIERLENLKSIKASVDFVSAYATLQVQNKTLREALVYYAYLDDENSGVANEALEKTK